MDSQEVETRLRALEQQLIGLKKHVEEQDSVIYTQSKQMKLLEKAIVQLKEGQSTSGPSDGMPADERPPHY